MTARGGGSEWIVMQPPVDPDAETARQWLVDELSRSEYSQGDQSLITRFLAWLNSLSAPDPSFSIPLAVILTVAIIVVVIVAALLGGRVRLGSRAQPSDVVVSLDDARTADQIRLDARRAADANDWSAATTEQFRAIARSLEERAVLDELAGRTAQELARAASPALPRVAPGLVDGARRFDSIRYGHVSVGQPDFDAMVALDTAVLAEHPQRAAQAMPVAASGGLIP